MIVYKITNKITNKSYIGCSKHSLEERWKSHVYKSNSGSPGYLHRSIAKYGKDSFDRVVLEKCYSHRQMFKSEIKYIEKFDTFNNGYNLTKGGEGRLGGTYVPTKETLLKLSLALKGKRKGKQSKEHIEKQRLQKLKKWKIIDPNGIETVVNNLREFCESNGLVYQSFYKSYSESRFHKGYRLEQYNG